MEIFQSKYEDYNYHWYLDICKQLNAKEQDDEFTQNGKKIRQKDRKDPNYDLEGYNEMKEEWRKKNIKK